ncbi:MAG: glycosyltransferase family 2 protein [Erysipelotrichales bacterium]|nr:glycosyltransferase family 2 protein [Erysipelotrichales bacterium]
MISVIIPVYNVAPYLNTCLDSVINQTYKNLEIIIVDDGSTDESGSICEDYAKIDSCIKVIHKKNAGLSSARNVGLEHAKGEWIFFIDSDDWFDTNTLSNLYEFAIRNQCDIVQCNHYYAYDTYHLYRLANKKEKKFNILDRKEAMHQLIINDRIKNFAWGKLYKTDLIRDIKFPEGKFFEDSFWQQLVFHRASKIGIIDTPYYFYRQRKDSISGQSSPKIYDLLEGYNKRLEFVLKNYPEYSLLMEKKYKELKKNITQNTNDNFFSSLLILPKKIYNRLLHFGKYKRKIYETSYN